MEGTFKTLEGLNLFYTKTVRAEDKAVCVVVHGLCEHGGRYDYVCQKLNEAGIGTYRFDHRGHGRSDGEKAYADDYNHFHQDTNTVVDMAIEENPDKPVFLLGHSMGGLSVCLYGIEYPGKSIKGIITTGAAIRDDLNIIGGVPAELDEHVQIPNTIGPAVCSVPEIVAAYESDPYTAQIFTPGIMRTIGKGMDYFNPNIQKFAYPVLIMHGEKDVLISYNSSINFFAQASSTDRQLKIYGGLFHEILNEYCRDEVISDIVHWIENRL